MADRVQLPQSGGGLVRYFDEYRSKLTIKPYYIIILIVIIIIIELFLYKM